MARNYLIFSVFIFLAPSTSFAWERPTIHDDQLVQLAECIVVGRVVPESIVSNWPKGAAGDTSVKIKVQNVLKGELLGGEISVILLDGLRPIVNIALDQSTHRVMGKDTYPLYVMDYKKEGGNQFASPPIVENSADWCIWLLTRKAHPLLDVEDEPDRLWRVSEPCQIRPIAEKTHFLKLIGNLTRVAHDQPMKGKNIPSLYKITAIGLDTSSGEESKKKQQDNLQVGHSETPPDPSRLGLPLESIQADVLVHQGDAWKVQRTHEKDADNWERLTLRMTLRAQEPYMLITLSLEDLQGVDDQGVALTLVSPSLARGTPNNLSDSDMWPRYDPLKGVRTYVNQGVVYLTFLYPRSGASKIQQLHGTVVMEGHFCADEIDLIDHKTGEPLGPRPNWNTLRGPLNLWEQVMGWKITGIDGSSDPLMVTVEQRRYGHEVIYTPPGARWVDAEGVFPDPPMWDLGIGFGVDEGSENMQTGQVVKSIEKVEENTRITQLKIAFKGKIHNMATAGFQVGFVVGKMVKKSFKGRMPFQIINSPLPRMEKAPFSAPLVREIKNMLGDPLALAKEAVETEPTTAEKWNDLGMVYFHQQYYDEAITAYGKALNLDPKFAKASNNIGNAYLSKGDMKSAVENFNHAVQIDPTFAEAYANMGIAYFRVHDLDGAIQAYTQATLHRAGYADVYCNLGVAYQEKGDLDKSVEAFTKTIMLNPRHEIARFNLGINFFQLKRFQEAIQQWEAVKKINPNNRVVDQFIEKAINEIKSN